jgi:WD40 repeat protein
VVWRVDGTLAASVVAGQGVLVLDPVAGRVLAEWTQHEDGPVYGLATHGGLVASTASSGEVVVWDLEQSRPVPLLPPPTPVDAVEFDATGSYLAGTAHHPAAVTVWALERSEPVLHLPGARAATWHPRFPVLASATTQGVGLHRFGSPGDAAPR